MINLLIADDNHSKLKEIQEKVLDYLEIKSTNITVVTDIINAKRELKEKQFDLFIVDIQLPRRFQDTPQTKGGLELIKELQGSKRYSLPSNIIGVTEFEESLESVSDEFDLHLYKLVKFDRSSDEWIHQLRNHIDHITKAKTSNLEREVGYDYDLAITCALEDVELQGLLNIDANWEELILDSDNTRYYTGIFKSEFKTIRVIIGAAEQMGMAPAAVLTMKLIQRFRPRYLAMSGITAGVKGQVNYGDIIVADPSWDYGSGKYILDENQNISFLPEPLPIRLDTDLKSKISRLCSNDKVLQEIKARWPANKPSESLKAHIGAAASGAAVLAHSTIVKGILKHNRKLLGIEMEAYGVLYAAQNSTRPRPSVFIAKSVCDFADEEKSDLYQSYAAYTSAMFIYSLALNYLEFE
ncbi:hypothetical protein PNF31_26465 [Priestia megaterium]|uniref:phosphorylase family protein n=1 Tax=Priestia megaterium TaxID=1404 RepID=UPI00234E4C42|nr:hypothetical protein [Priestia megaterium]MDC7724272.1 hypothetical protein [Priestia megaterium]